MGTTFGTFHYIFITLYFELTFGVFLSFIVYSQIFISITGNFKGKGR